MIRHAPSLGLGLGLSLRPFTFGSGGSGPIPGAVLDLSNFDFSFVDVTDVSGEGNNAILYSARGVSFSGSGYVELPDVGATKSITVLARSTTETTLYATDNATQTEDASAVLVANDTWQEVTLTFASAISGKIRLGSDGLNSFSGELADAVCLDGSGATLDEFYLNEHTDTAAAGLDGLLVVGRNGSIGQYVGGAAVIQEGIDPTLLPISSGFDDYQYFNGVDTQINFPTVTSTGDFWVEFDLFYVRNGELVTNILYFSNLERLFIRETDKIRFEIDNQQYQYSDLSLIENALNSVRFERIGAQGTLTINGESQTLTVLTSTWRFNEIGPISGAGHLKGFFVNFQSSNGPSYLGYGPTPWADTIGSNDGTPIGNFTTVGQLLTTPPQVLGMDFNQYRYFNGVDTQIDCGSPLVPANDDFVLSGIAQTFYDGSTNKRVFAQYSGPPAEGRFLVSTRNGNLNMFIGSSLGNISIQSSGVDLTQPFNWEVERTGNTFTLRINGVDVGSLTRNISIHQGANSLIGNEPTFPNSYFEGINQVFLDGVELTGTEAGAFEDVLVPKAPTGNLDALGNPIEKPRTSDTFNADGVGYALAPDSGASSNFQTESLGILNEATWVFRGNFHGPVPDVSETILAKWGLSSGTRSFLFVINSGNAEPNELRISLSRNGTAVYREDYQTIDADSLWVIRYDGPNGILKVERDGVELVSQDSAGGFPSSLKVTDVPLIVCANGEEGDAINLSSRPISDIKIFKRYLTDEEVQSL